MNGTVVTLLVLNVLQVIPGENLPVSNASDSRATQVFQVGNMLQVVPGASPTPASPQHVVMKQAKGAVPPPPATPQPAIQAHGTAEMSVGHSPIASSPIAKVDSSSVVSCFQQRWQWCVKDTSEVNMIGPLPAMCCIYTLWSCARLPAWHLSVPLSRHYLF